MYYIHAVNLPDRGWVPKTKGDIDTILEEIIARRAVLAYMPIYARVTGNGPIVPDECNLSSEKDHRRGAGGQVLRFIYDHLGDKLIFEVVPNTMDGTAQVRAVMSDISGENKCNWVPFTKSFI